MNSRSDDSFELDPNACTNVFADKDKFKLFINYRGKPTEQLAKSFRKLNAPCSIIMTTKKLRSSMPSLKSFVPHMFQSNVVYKIQCPSCNASYVGQTTRQLQRRFREHIVNKGPVKIHFEKCQVVANSDLVQIIGRADCLPRLLTLEALFIHQMKPEINTKDEYRSRALTLKF